MFEVVTGLEEGYLLSLATLRFALDRISGHQLKWWIHGVDLDCNCPKVSVCQRDDANTLRISDICYSIPILEKHVDCGGEGMVLVTLHGGTLDPESPGYYLTPEEIMEDAMADFESFWYPLADLLDVYTADWLARLSRDCSNLVRYRYLTWSPNRRNSEDLCFIAAFAREQGNARHVRAQAFRAIFSFHPRSTRSRVGGATGLVVARHVGAQVRLRRTCIALTHISTSWPPFRSRRPSWPRRSLAPSGAISISPKPSVGGLTKRSKDG